jgi:glycosyltransferase involved in cell wall biosynthesis
VVPTFNRADALCALLEGIAQLDYPPERVQVLVVNDGGAPLSREAQRAFEVRLQVRWLDQKNQGPAVARNYGAQHAVGTWLAFIDDDCVPERGWLRALAEALNPDVLVGGAVLNGCPADVYATASQCLFDFLYEYYHRPEGAHSQAPFFTSNNLALARELFGRHDGFDARLRLGEDREFCARLGAKGVAMRYTARARVMHYRPLRAQTFWKQHWQYGMGAFEYHRRVRVYRRDTILPEPLRFYANMLRFPWRQARGARALHLMGLVAMAQIANVCGFGSAALRARRA